MKKRNFLLITILIILTAPISAYVGPGAGFAFAGSFLFIFIAFFLAIFNFLTFPIRAFVQFLKRIKTLKNAKFKRTVIIGFDGMDYNRLNMFMKEGEKFPNFEKLMEEGTFAPLQSTEPPISPVAWSSFSTGVNPGKHNIFDFLATDRNTYMPKMSGSDIIPPKKVLKVGKYTIPLSKAKVELMRKSKSFWKIVSSKGIFSSVLRIPYSFPPEKFYGLMLSGLGTPDLRGTQGSFSFYSSEKKTDTGITEGVIQEVTEVSDGIFNAVLKGPGHPFIKGSPSLEEKFSITLDKEKNGAKIKIGRDEFFIEKGKITEWKKVNFKVGLIKIAGIAQFFLEEADPLKLYISPINIDPGSPSMSVSHPKIFSVYLSKLIGGYATLGMAEDTWALNERVLSEDGFIQQVYSYQEEREKMFWDTFKKFKRGLLVQVYEETDRIQHMFWRYLSDSGSPADKPSREDHIVNAIKRSYKRMDDFLGRLMPKLGKNDLLMIVSDHGFNKVNRDFHLNSWLHKEGYLVLKDGKTSSDKFYKDVDWSKSRAYGQGLHGIFVNMKGRERHGIVSPGKEAEDLKAEIKQKLKDLKDIEKGDVVAKGVYKREELYKGPYTKNAPDVVIGYNLGYRVSPESAVNYIGDTIISDNTRMWSGDHSFTRAFVPGIFFCNKKIKTKHPSIMDISPTILSAFGIKKPSFIDGNDLEVVA